MARNLQLSQEEDEVKKVLAILGIALGLLASTTACSEIAASDKVGLWYAQGQYDGDKFDHCVTPGKSDKVSFNDTVFWLPTSVRTWNAAPSGGDTNQPLVLTAKPDNGQTSGIEVNVWTQTTLKINTWCGSDEKDGSAPFVRWWNDLGRRYAADTDKGWDSLLNATVVPALEKAKNTLRGYTADQLVLGTVWAEAEPQFAKTFSEELTRLSGGQYFCGPSFNRAKPDCPAVEVSIKDVDYRDPGIQTARNEKQKALELAQAKVIAAQGDVDAAEKQKSLYNNPAWVALEKAKIQLEIAKACGANPNCHMIMGADGTIITT
jgi:hypothetical protein